MGYTVLLLAEFECAARREGCSDQLPKLGDRRRVPGRLIAHPCAADSQERNHTTSQLASIIYYGVVEAFFRYAPHPPGVLPYPHQCPTTEPARDVFPVWTLLSGCKPSHQGRGAHPVVVHHGMAGRTPTWICWTNPHRLLPHLARRHEAGME